MSEPDQPIVDESARLPPNAADEGLPPATGDDELPSRDGPRFVLPPIDWARVAHRARRAFRIGAFVVVASFVLGGGAVVLATFYSQYGAIRNSPNAQAWGELTPRFAGLAICASCHAPEAAVQDASAHINVSCEDCHGPAAAHSDSAAAARAIPLANPPSAICVTCHGATAGRPTAVTTIDPARHYAGGSCLRCHGPHSIVALRPPTVSHPLANLPECTTCHAPDGLKKIPTGHELVGDSVCLSCHGRTANGKPGAR